jgi:RNA polymerase sigma-70 factor (ECF subfamily)
MNERELVAQARGGDREALRVLLSKHRREVLARIRRRIPAALGRKLSAADLYQEASLAAFERIGEFEDRGEGSFGRWLCRIAEIRLKDQLRRFGRQRRALDREQTRAGRPATSAFRSEDPTPSQAAMASERRAAVGEALAGIPEHYREILRLVQTEGLRLRDAAGRVGKSYEATKKLYGRALNAFSEAWHG